MSGPFGSTTWMSNPSTEFYGHEITKSLRFDAPATPFLNFTPGSASNLRTWTWSGWLKKDTRDSQFHTVFAATTELNAGNSHSYISYYLDDLYIQDYTASGNTKNYHFITDAKFRDPSAWKHVVFALDTTQATASNRAKLYVNGVQVTFFSTETYPAEDFDGKINSTLKHFIGNGFGSQPEGNNYAGYLADVNFIDGLQLGPSSFGELKNDIWISKDTSGLTFGTNGFRQQYKQTGTGTAGTSTIGADTSGEDNHYTSNNLAAHDVVPDSPTNNFATYNALMHRAGSAPVLSEGNLTAVWPGYWFGSTVGITSGKWYWEYTITAGTVGSEIGIATANRNFSGGLSNSGVGASYGYITTGQKFTSSTLSDYGASWTTGDIIGIAFDYDNGTLTFYKNNSTQDATFTDIEAATWIPAFGNNSGSSMTARVNFGQDSSFAGTETAQGNADGNGIGDFYYAPPSGFLAMCTSNMTAPVATIDPAEGGSPQDYFNTVLYTGNGGTQSITGVGFQPDWVWFKSRSFEENHALYDSVRGATKDIRSDVTNAENTNSTGLTAFGSDGFSIGSVAFVNQNSATYAAWNWKAGTSFSNDASSTSVGSIDSAGSVNTDVGFSIISYTGTGSAGTVAHGLGVALQMIIVKNRSAADAWQVYHENIASDAQTDYLVLNTTAAAVDDAGRWNDTAPTTAVFSIGADVEVNTSSENYIAYCFASVDGYSKFGSYTGNGNADGTFVYTGFRPAFVMTKRTDSTGSWEMYDAKRIGYNTANYYVYAQGINADGTDIPFDILSNGFKRRSTGGSANASGGTYIYMAFAEQPFKYANAR